MNIIGAVIVLLAVVALVGAWTLRPLLQHVAGPVPNDFSSTGFDHSSFELLLQRFVTADGRVDYARWHADPTARDQLSRYLSAVAKFSPENHPERFATAEERTVYWFSAYNAQVIGAILARWPLSSVTDVKAPIEVVRGLGFFYKLRFEFGGEMLSLYDVEHRFVLKGAQDARVHFVLNCGSASCPVQRPKLPSGADLEPYLAQAARDFVSDQRNVSVDHGKKQVVLSKIFDWYKSDFLDEMSRRGQARTRGLLGYIALIAPAELAAQLEAARDYDVVFHSYDWSINSGVHG